MNYKVSSELKEYQEYQEKINQLGVTKIENESRKWSRILERVSLDNIHLQTDQALGKE